MASLNILYEDNHIIVVEKPVNVPVQADESNDEDMLTLIKNYLREAYQKPGNIFVGLIHRLDRPVGGVMVFAKTSKAASRLSDQVRTHQLQKVYQCITIKQPKTGQYRDKLLKDTKTNTVKVDSRGKDSILTVIDVTPLGNRYLSTIELKTGRSHQIRVQFASRHTPLWGDQRYNPEAVPPQQIALWAVSLTFEHPTKKEKMTFTSHPPKQYPW